MKMARRIPAVLVITFPSVFATTFSVCGDVTDQIADRDPGVLKPEDPSRLANIEIGFQIAAKNVRSSKDDGAYLAQIAAGPLFIIKVMNGGDGREQSLPCAAARRCRACT